MAKNAARSARLRLPVVDTEAILAQGANRADALAQAFLRRLDSAVANLAFLSLRGANSCSLYAFSHGEFAGVIKLGAQLKQSSFAFHQSRHHQTCRFILICSLREKGITEEVILCKYSRQNFVTRGSAPSFCKTFALRLFQRAPPFVLLLGHIQFAPQRSGLV